MNWLLTQPGVASLVIGTRRTKNPEDNIGCLDFALTDDQLARLGDVSKIELGFPHDLIHNPVVRKMLTGNTQVSAS